MASPLRNMNHGKRRLKCVPENNAMKELSSKRPGRAVGHLNPSSVEFNNAWSCNSTPPYYLLTPWSTVLLEKLPGSAASQEIPCIFGTRRFITVFTSARHQTLSWANPIQSPQPPPTSWRSILILSSHLRLGLPSGLFPSGDRKSVV
jgi:hypothetical protein